MKFLKPVITQEYPLKLSKETILLLKQYAKYCHRSVDEIADSMIAQLNEDPDFLEYINKKRYNKKLLSAVRK